MTEDESLRPSNNPLSTFKFSPSQLKKEITADLSNDASAILSNGHAINGLKMYSNNHHKKDVEALKLEDLKVISNGFAQLKTENGYLEDGQQPCSSSDIQKDVQMKFKCPHTSLFLEEAYPDFDSSSREKIEELIIDDMSLILFSTLDEYKSFKTHEDLRRKKLDSLRKQQEREELTRLALIKREKVKSKRDAMKEKEREKNRQLREQRAFEREQRREERERMKHEKILDKERRKRWKAEYLHRKTERAERRQVKLKKLEERAKKEQQQQLATSEVPGPSLSASVKQEAAAHSSNLFASPPVPSSSRVINTPGCLPGPSSKPSSYLLNDFSNQKVAMEALQTLAGMSSNPRLKRPAENSSPSRKNGVIFSPSTKIPKLEPMSNSTVVKTDPNEVNRKLQSNGFFKQEKLTSFDHSLLAQMPPSTSAEIHGQGSNLNTAFATGASKTAAQVANFMRSSQTPQFEIQQVLNENPQLAMIFTQALASGSGLFSNMGERKPSASSVPGLPGLSHPGTMPSAPLSHYAMVAAAANAAGVPTPNVNSSVLLGAAPSQPPPSTKPPQNNVGNPAASLTLGISASAASSKPNINPSSAAPPSTSVLSSSKLPNTTPSISIQFPKEAALGSQLAGAAVLGQKQFARAPLSAAALTPTQWCNKHVTIAQTISNKLKEADAASRATATVNQHPKPSHHNSNDVAKKAKMSSASTSMPPPANIPQQKQVQQQNHPQSQQQSHQLPQQQISNHPVNNLRPQMPPPQSNAAVANSQQQQFFAQIMQNQLNAQNPMAQWQQMMRFQQPGAPGITTGIPPTPQQQQHHQQQQQSELASQELAKFYRQNQQKDQQQQPGQRPPSQQVERAASVAPGLQNGPPGLPASSVAAFTAMLQQSQNASNLNAFLAAAATPQAPQFNPAAMNGQQSTDQMVRMLQLHMQQQQQQQTIQALVQADIQQRLAEAQAQQARVDAQARAAQAQAQAQQQQQQQQAAQQQAQVQAQQQAAAARMQNPGFPNGFNFHNLFGLPNPPPGMAGLNNVRPNAMNMFNPLMDRDKQLSAAIAAASQPQQQQQNAGIPSSAVQGMQTRPNFNQNTASAANMLQQLFREQQNTHLAFSAPNGMPPHSQAALNFELAQHQLMALQQQAAVAAGAGGIRPNMLPPQLMNNNPAARNMLDMSQFAKMQFPQGGPKRD